MCFFRCNHRKRLYSNYFLLLQYSMQTIIVDELSPRSSLHVKLGISGFEHNMIFVQHIRTTLLTPLFACTACLCCSCCLLLLSRILWWITIRLRMIAYLTVRLLLHCTCASLSLLIKILFFN